MLPGKGPSPCHQSWDLLSLKHNFHGSQQGGYVGQGVSTRFSKALVTLVRSSTLSLRFASQEKKGHLDADSDEERGGGGGC